MRKMRKLLIVAVAAIALIAVAVVQADTLTASSAVGPGGTKAKPKPNAPSFGFTATGATATARPATPKTLINVWTGEQENGAGFPVCTSAMIQAKQSNSVCPSGSLVGQGTLQADVGPAGLVNSNVKCSKQIFIYNAGGNTAATFLAGPGSACAGVGYLPPINVYWSNAGGNATLTLPVPQNVAQPLPGVQGAIAGESIKFKKLVTPGKHGHGYLSGIGCGKSKTRSFTTTVQAPSLPGGQVSTTVSAGKC
jgi:hypothetical protein